MSDNRRIFVSSRVTCLYPWLMCCLSFFRLVFVTFCFQLGDQSQNRIRSIAGLESRFHCLFHCLRTTGFQCARNCNWPIHCFLSSSALDKIILNGYIALGLMYFFTSGEDEVKAWTISVGLMQFVLQINTSINSTSIFIHQSTQFLFLFACCQTK